MRNQQGSYQVSHTLADRYEVMAFLGGGDSTEVYRVKDLIGGRELALKILRGEAPKEAEIGLRREFYYLSRFSHPGIVSAFDYGTTAEQRPFFSMELFEGLPVHRYFADGYAPALAEVTLQVLSALDSIHAQGLIHCDIKPQHILVRAADDRRPLAKLLDFGFADRVRLTGSAEPRGTLGYVAPEVFKGTDADARADLYSLGIVLYETITGRGPAQQKDLRGWLREQYYSDLEPPRRFEPKIPDRFEEFVLSLVRREPERRPRSAAAAAEVLGGGLADAVSAGPRKYLMAPGFVGRAETLAGLKSRLDAAAQGRAGVACLSGERGVGKSRLLAEFKFLAQLEGATILSFEPVSLGARPQSLVELMLDHLKVLGLVGAQPRVPEAGEAADDAKYRLFEAVSQGLRELSASRRVSHSLIVLVDDFELFDPTSLEFLRYLAFSLTSERLFVVVAGLKEQRYLDLIAEFERRDPGAHVPVPPMTGSEVRQLAVSMLGDLPDAEFLAEWLTQTTGGSPLFALETLHSLIENRILNPRGSHWTLAPEALQAYRPPGSVTDVVRRRLEGLSREEIEVLQAGAARGGPFSLDFLRAVVGLDEKVLFNAVGRLSGLGLLRGFSGGGEAAFALTSKILEAAVTERLSVQERRESHRRVALALELLYPDEQERLVFDLAHHYAQAGIGERAYAYSLRAGARARELVLLEQALGFYEAALGLPGRTSGTRERVNLIETVGELREATGRHAEALDIYTQGMSLLVADRELSREKELLARFLRKIGLVHQKQNRNDDALTVLNQALLLQPDKTADEYVNILCDLGWTLCARGELERSERLLTQALQLAERRRLAEPPAGNRLAARTLYYFSVLAWTRADFALALQLAERALGLYEGQRDEYHTGRVSQFIATLWWRRGDSARAEEVYQRHLLAHRKAGDVYFLLRSLQGLGVIAQDEDRWDRARDCFAEAYGLAERIGDLGALADIGANLGAVRDEQGDWPAAQRLAEQAIVLQDRPGSGARPLARAATRGNLLELRSRQGELSDAERLLLEVRSIAVGQKDPLLEYTVCRAEAYWALRAEKLDQARQALARGLLATRRSLDRLRRASLVNLAAELRLAAGEYERAGTAAARALALLSNGRTGRERAIALRWAGLAKALSGRVEKGMPEIRQSIDCLRQLGSRYELGLSLFASAQALTSRNPGEMTVDLRIPLQLRPVAQETLEQVVQNLKEARGIFRQLEARVDLRRADELAGLLEQVSSTMQLKSGEQGEYLKVFYQLSELISADIGQEDFFDRILDLVIKVTRAERGLLFLAQGERLVPAAARNMDPTTRADAESVSQSVLRKVKRRGEAIFSADAMADPRFNVSNSVMLNKIHSLLCAPLRSDSRVVGTVYLDSRITAHLFLEEDQNLLLSVANLLGATIEKSLAFRRVQEEMRGVREEILVDAVTGYFLGRSRAVLDVYRVVDRIAPTDCTVLITGETGTGKGILARLIHSKSERKGNRFVSINCGTLPETLFESELFGHARGAFTGAVRDKEGLLETAENGTIFLDEIANTSLGTQAKLLQVLEEKVIRRVGETQPRQVDVRLVLATNRNLEEEVKAGRVRQDLYYRMNVVSIRMPPMRERQTDIPILAQYFLSRYCTQLNKPLDGFDQAVLNAFRTYSWPGNVRELQNVIERAVIMAQTRSIGIVDVGPDFGQLIQAGPTAAVPYQRKPREIGRDEIVRALRDTAGNVSHAAEALSVHRRQLQRLIRRHRIDRTSLA